MQSLDDVMAFLRQLSPPRHDGAARHAYLRQVLAALGNPQNTTPVIHIAGTSGKGSTASYATALLHEAGYRTGTIVSPHMYTVRERSQINAAPLDEASYLDAFNRFTTLTQSHGWHLSYLEFLITFAFWLFREQQVDYAVVEVGIGGRLDMTNVIDRDDTICVITDIGLDHTELLGDSLTHIATEKAGIIHSGADVVMFEQSSDIVTAVQRRCDAVSASLTLLPPSYHPLTAKLPQYQQRNWTLAHQAVLARLSRDQHSAPAPSALEKSLHTRIPGRWERHVIDGVEVIFDAAHNPQKMTALTDALHEAFPGQNPITILALGDAKQATLRQTITPLDTLSQEVIITSFYTAFNPPRRSIVPELITPLLNTPRTIEPDASQALVLALARARAGHTYVVVTGSFYLLDALLNRPATPQSALL